MAAKKSDRGMLAGGARAPSFHLRALDGSMYSLEEILARGPAVLAFFKVSCPVCQLTSPFLERLHQRRQEGGLQFIGISQDAGAPTREYNQEFGVTFPTLLDDPGDYPASNAFGISHVPSLFLVEQDGSVSWSVDGFSKRELEALGRRAGVAPFLPGEYVPEWKAG
jgi:peroxiredoxin